MACRYDREHERTLNTQSICEDCLHATRVAAGLDDRLWTGAAILIHTTSAGRMPHSGHFLFSGGSLSPQPLCGLCMCAIKTSLKWQVVPRPVSAVGPAPPLVPPSSVVPRRHPSYLAPSSPCLRVVVRGGARVCGGVCWVCVYVVCSCTATLNFANDVLPPRPRHQDIRRAGSRVHAYPLLLGPLKAFDDFPFSRRSSSRRRVSVSLSRRSLLASGQG